MVLFYTMNIKKRFFILILFCSFAGYSHAQQSEALDSSMKKMMLVGDDIFYQGMELKLGLAKDIALTNNKTQAYSFFKKAKRMRSWNYVWSILGGYEVGAGLLVAVSGNPLGWLDVGIGGGLIALVVAREDEIENYKRLGIQEFNK
jgi:hypothetical protein